MAAALLSAVLAAAVGLATAAGGWLPAAAAVVVLVVLTLGAVQVAEVPGALAAGWLALLVGTSAAAGVAVAGRADPTPVAAVLGLSIVVAIALQLGRRGGRPRVTASLTMAVTACGLAVLPAYWVALATAEGGGASVALGLVGVVVAVLVEALPGSRAMIHTLAVLAAGAAGAAASVLFGAVREVAPPLNAVVLSAFAGVIASAALSVADRLTAAPSTGEPAGLAAATAVVPLRASLPLVTAAPVTYLLGRILVG